MTERIEKRYREKHVHKEKPLSPARARRMRNLGFAVAAAALLLAVLLPLRHVLEERVGNESEEGIRVKGLNPHLIYYRKEEGGIVQIKGGEHKGQYFAF